MTHVPAARVRHLTKTYGTGQAMVTAGAPNRITFSGERLTIEVRAWQGGRFAATRKTEYMRKENGWSPRSARA